MKIENEEEDIFKEVSILSTLRHPNIVMFCGISVDDHNNYYIISEFVERGSLDTLLYNLKNKSKRDVLQFEEKLNILIGISSGMAYLHSLQPPLIHRDLKPQNILISKDMTPQICDFGMSKFIVNSDMTAKTIGTQGYISPEILSGEATYSSKVDVYSFGIMMHEIFFLEKPYRSLSSKSKQIWNPWDSGYSFGKKVLNGARPEIPFHLEDQPEIENWFSLCNKPGFPFHYAATARFFKLVESCWDHNPDNRPSFNEIADNLEEISQEVRLVSSHLN